MLLLGLVAGSLLFVRPAAAHAELIGSDPASGAVLARAPDVATLRFSEAISPEFSSVRLVDDAAVNDAGKPVPAPGVAGRGRVLTVRLPSLGKGSYGLVWRVLAEDDGHITSGVVVFSVGTVGAGTRPGGVAPDVSGTTARPDAVITRWLRLCLLSGLIGGLGVAGLVLGRARGGAAGTPTGASADALAGGIGAARLRLLRLAGACALLGAVVGASDVARGPGPIGHVLAGTRWGHLWLARTAVLCAIAACAEALRRAVAHGGSRARALWFGTGALVVAVAVIEAMGGHAASAGSVGTARTIAVGAAAVHILTACLWLGAVAALVVIAWPRAEDRSTARGVRLDLLRACRRPFTRLALVSFGLVVATGLYNTGSQVDTAGALITTAYGRTLLVKIAILSVVAYLALRNATDAGPGRGMRRIVAEAGAGVLLLLAVGLLAETAPGRGTPAPPVSAAYGGASSGAAGQTRVGGGTAADLVVSATVTPNRPGANGFTVLAASSRRPAPAPIDGVALRLPTGTTELRQLEPGRYFGTANLPAAGAARLDVVIQRADGRLTVPVSWTVSAPPAQPDPAVGRRAAAGSSAGSGLRLAPVLIPAAWIIFGIVVAFGAWWPAMPRVRRRRPDAATEPATEELEHV